MANDSPLDKLGDKLIERLTKLIESDDVSPQDLEVARKLLKDAGWSLVPEEMAEPGTPGQRLKEALGRKPSFDIGEVPFE